MSERKYSIKDLENFTQIKAHTIRIWEQRYGLFEPERTKTNIRYYSEDNLKKILNINLLYNQGWKISKIAQLSDKAILETAKKFIDSEKSDYKHVLDDLVIQILDFNEASIIRILEKYKEDLGLVSMYSDIILPILERIGKLWQVNTINVVHEHFFSNLFRNFLIDNIQSISDKKKSGNSETAILFLHSNEQHEIGLLIYHYILKSRGVNCLFFGQRTPIEDIQLAFQQVKPQLVVTSFITTISPKEFNKVFDALKDFSKSSTVYLSGHQLTQQKFKLTKGMIWHKTIEDLQP